MLILSLDFASACDRSGHAANKKVLLSVNTSNVERGWFLGSFVVILSVCAHSYARPYKSGLIDACEFVSLLSTLLIFQMGMVWNSTTVDPDGRLTTVLEACSLVLMLITSILGVGVEIQMIRERHLHPGGEEGDEAMFENPLDSEDLKEENEMVENVKDVTELF